MVETMNGNGNDRTGIPGDRAAGAELESALLLVKEPRLDLGRPFDTLPGPPLTRHPDRADLADAAGSPLTRYTV
jgi:hypothetical protein